VAARLAAYQAAVSERLRRAELGRAAAEARAVEERKRRRVLLALATAVLALVAVGSGGGLLVQHQAAERRAEQARREAERRQQVEAALDKAAALRQQAHWGEAQAVLEQARQALGGGGPDDLRSRLDVAGTELALVNRLDAIRQRRATWVKGHFDNRGAAQGYADAFEAAGLGKVGDEAATVAARVRASGVRGPLIAALDDWAFVTTQVATHSWLLEVARQADPDPWRDRLREAARWHDRQALQALADEALADGGARLDQLSPQALESLGQRLKASGADAVPLLRAAQRRYPSDFWVSLALGNALHDAKRDEEAVGFNRVAVALRPDAGAAHNNLGVTLSDTGDMDGAVAEFRKAIELDPKLAFAHDGLGQALSAKNDLAGAVAEFRQFVELNPEDAKARYNLGNTQYANGDVDGAIATFRKAIELDPTLAATHNALGNALRAKGDPDGAVAAYRKAIDCNPRHANAHIGLGNILADKGDVDGAIAEFHKAIEIDPKHATAHYNLGNTLRAKGDVDGAIAEYRKAIDSDPKYAEAHCNLGSIFRGRGQFAEALEEYRLGHALGSQRPRWRFPSADWVRQAERFTDLDGKLPAILRGEIDPADAADRCVLGQLCQQYKQRYAAAAHFYAGAFAADGKLAADPGAWHRYNAACCAALANAGQGQDAKNLPDKVQRMLRRQALAWLRADLAQYAQRADREEPAAKQFVGGRMRHWQGDTDLVSVRDKAALDQLPDEERQQWRQFWDDVAALLKKVSEKPK
jgi:tetratricopeptide (TPR) repeat protein